MWKGFTILQRIRQEGEKQPKERKRLLQGECVAGIAFTARGMAAGERIGRWVGAQQGQWRLHDGRKTKARQWAQQYAPCARVLVCIGAAGIAVRVLAPHLRSKAQDPAVLVVDENERFVIPLLSGHMGGANALAEELAAFLGAQAVITTATDGRGVFAVDSWAVAQGLRIANPERIVEVSSALLAGQAVQLCSDLPIAGSWPAGLVPEPASVTCSVSLDERKAEQGLLLVPPMLTLGVGCRKGVAQEAIQEAFAALCRAHHWHERAFVNVASIDIKQQEAGLLAFCRAHGWPLVCHAAGALSALEGIFSASEWVRATVGVDNVCERAAVLTGGGRLLVRKQAQAGVTLAVAAAPYSLTFAKRQRGG